MYFIGSIAVVIFTIEISKIENIIMINVTAPTIKELSRILYWSNFTILVYLYYSN
jgi:hypothetical protein